MGPLCFEHMVSELCKQIVELSRSQPAKADLQQVVYWKVTLMAYAHMSVIIGAEVQQKCMCIANYHIL